MSLDPQLIKPHVAKLAGKLIDVAEDIAEGRVKPREVQENPFRDALRERTAVAFVTPLLIAINVGLFFTIAYKVDGPVGDPQTLLNWGANFGPMTTNGGWWRLVASMFLHAGFIQLVVNMAGVAQVGLILERLVGRLALVTTYLGAGILARVLSMSGDPLGVTYGSSAAIFGVYGLFTATFVLGIRGRTATSIPIGELKKLAPAAGIFFLYNLGVGGQHHLLAFGLGFAGGIVMAMGIGERKAQGARVAVTAAATAIAIGFMSVPLRGIADVRPQITILNALEAKTTSAYDLAMLRFRNNRITRDGLAKIIDGEILPGLASAQERLLAIQGVPAQHRPIVASADEYLRLRQDSFRLRLEGLRKSSMKTLQQAEVKEIAAREALERVKL
jgi:membrane associated rhomboid family serine protease